MRTSRDSAIGLSFQPEDAWPQSALASAASQGHPRLPTRPAHPAGRTSTGSPLLDAHSGSGSTCRTSSGSSSAQEPDEEQPPRARPDLVVQREILARGGSGRVRT